MAEGAEEKVIFEFFKLGMYTSFGNSSYLQKLLILGWFISENLFNFLFAFSRRGREGEGKKEERNFLHYRRAQTCHKEKRYLVQLLDSLLKTLEI